MSDQRGYSLAVVDDDSLARRALERLLVTMGFAVAAFASAEAFLACAESRAFRCLLLDVQLGGMSGPELSTRLVAEGCEMPIIFLSAAADAEEVVRKTTGRAGVVLAKPLDAERLRAVLDAVLAA
jgi:FixJ family two-component response regulator